MRIHWKGDEWVRFWCTRTTKGQDLTNHLVGGVSRAPFCTGIHGTPQTLWLSSEPLLDSSLAERSHAVAVKIGVDDP